MSESSNPVNPIQWLTLPSIDIIVKKAKDDAVTTSDFKHWIESHQEGLRAVIDEVFLDESGLNGQNHIWEAILSGGSKSAEKFLVLHRLFGNETHGYQTGVAHQFYTLDVLGLAWLTSEVPVFSVLAQTLAATPTDKQEEIIKQMPFGAFDWINNTRLETPAFWHEKTQVAKQNVITRSQISVIEVLTNAREQSKTSDTSKSSSYLLIELFENKQWRFTPIMALQLLSDIDPPATEALLNKIHSRHENPYNLSDAQLAEYAPTPEYSPQRNRVRVNDARYLYSFINKFLEPIYNGKKILPPGGATSVKTLEKLKTISFETYYSSKDMTIKFESSHVDMREKAINSQLRRLNSLTNIQIACRTINTILDNYALTEPESYQTSEWLWLPLSRISTTSLDRTKRLSFTTIAALNEFADVLMDRRIIQPLTQIDVENHWHRLVELNFHILERLKSKHDIDFSHWRDDKGNSILHAMPLPKWSLEIMDFWLPKYPELVFAANHKGETPVDVWRAHYDGETDIFQSIFPESALGERNAEKVKIDAAIREAHVQFMKTSRLAIDPVAIKPRLKHRI